MNDLSRLTIKEAVKGLAEKKFSSKELTESCFSRIKEVEPKIKSFLEITEELAIKKADEADRLLQTKQSKSQLTGIPVGIKDILVTRGVKTTAGSKILADFIPQYSATVYEKLEDNHAVPVGKTNLDEFAMGASTENSAFQITKNPWDLSRVPGGSSGGSAAAVAADMSIYALGTDTGGSVRQPASFCGVVGLKPTYGRVSRYGLIAMASSLDQIGPITKTVEDAAIVLNEIAGFDEKDSTSVDREVPDYKRFLTGDIKNIKVGVPKEFIGGGVDKHVAETVRKATDRLASLGANVIEISLPSSEHAISVYYLLMPSEASTNLARYDGVRFGGTRDLFGPEVKRRIMLGTYALSAGYYDAYYLKAAKVRTQISAEFKRAFEKVDAIVSPTSPVLPFKIGEKVEDPLQMYLADILTVPVNLAGIPGISIPCGLVSGLPVGLQILTNHFEEGKLLNLAYAYEQNFPFGEKPKL